MVGTGQIHHYHNKYKKIKLTIYKTDSDVD